MSSATLAYADYDAVSSMVSGLALALTDVKRVALGLPGAGAVPALQLEASRSQVADYLSMAAAAGRGGVEAEGLGRVGSWIRIARAGDTADPEAVEAIRERLLGADGGLTEEDCVALSRMVVALDVYAEMLRSQLPKPLGRS